MCVSAASLVNYCYMSVSMSIYQQFSIAFVFVFVVDNYT